MQKEARTTARIKTMWTLVMTEERTTEKKRKQVVKANLRVLVERIRKETLLIKIARREKVLL